MDGMMQYFNVGLRKNLQETSQIEIKFKIESCGQHCGGAALFRKKKPLVPRAGQRLTQLRRS